MTLTMKKILLTIAITLAFFGTAKAIVVQKVILNNGSELSGYTKSSGTDGKLVFEYDQALMCLDGSEVKEITNEHSYQLYEVDAKWSECEEMLEGEGENRTVSLSDVVLTNGKTVQKVKVLERGVRVKYLEMASNSYILSWKDISAIKAKRRDKNLISGINREYQTESGITYEGQYAGETNSTLSLYLDNGVIQTLDVNDVVRYTYHKLNPNQPIIEQSQLIDIVKTKNGNSVQGIIVEQNYTNNDEAFLVVEQENGNKQNILLSELAGIERKVNDNYKPKSDIVLNVGDVVINRGSTASFCNVNEDKDEVMTLEKPNLQIRVKAGVNTAWPRAPMKTFSNWCRHKS